MNIIQCFARNKFLAALLLLTFFSSCVTTLKPIGFRSVKNFTVKKITSTPELSVDINLFNPNPVGVKLKNFNMDFSLNNIFLASIHQDKVSHWAANQEFTIPLTTSTSLSQLEQMIPSIKSIINGNEIPMQLKGSVRVKKFIFGKTFPFEFNPTINSKNISKGL